MLGNFKEIVRYDAGYDFRLRDYVSMHQAQLQGEGRHDPDVPFYMFNECMYYMQRALAFCRSSLISYTRRELQTAVIASYYSSFCTMVSFTRYASEPLVSQSPIFRLVADVSKPYTYSLVSVPGGQDFHRAMWNAATELATRLSSVGKPAPSPDVFRDNGRVLRNDVNYTAFKVPYDRRGHSYESIESEFLGLARKTQFFLSDYLYRLLQESEQTPWQGWFFQMLARERQLFRPFAPTRVGPSASLSPDFDMLLV